MQRIILLYTGIILLMFSVSVEGQKLHLKLSNQVSSWGTLNAGDPLRTYIGVQYLPTVSIVDSLRNNHKIDTEISANLRGDALFSGSNFDDKNLKIRPYRFWLRYSGPRFELRLGLQKINFGSASVIRPLMWFDKMDYRDPLQLTDGVYAFLARYYFQNNTNIWLWSLYGNDQPMGWDVVPSDRKVPEFGGRVQKPVPRGEIALSYHHRKADFSAWLDTIPFISKTAFPEDKIGIDGKWDIGPGIGFEFVLKHNDPGNRMVKKWDTYFNLNMDYTFNLGNGLNVNCEYFRYTNTSDLTKAGVKNTFTALTVNYPFGLMNSITAVVYYNWEPKEWFRFISVQRKYDYWTFYIMAFWNPENSGFNRIAIERNLYGGKGFQLMAVVNF